MEQASTGRNKAKPAQVKGKRGSAHKSTTKEIREIVLNYPRVLRIEGRAVPKGLAPSSSPASPPVGLLANSTSTYTGRTRIARIGSRLSKSVKEIKRGGE